MYRSPTISNGFKGKIKNKRHKIKELSNKNNSFEKNYFCILPDEIILKIFSKLPQCILMTCCPMVCKRWNKLSDDFSLWRNVNYGKRTIRITHIRKLFALQVEQLDFSKARLKNYVPLFPVPFKMRYAVKRFSRLQYLYLNGFSFLPCDNTIKHFQHIPKFTTDILSVCAYLKVLKLQNICLNSAICRHISMNKDLKELYWISCTLRRSLKNYILKLFKQCKKLETVDFSYTNFPDEEMWSVTNNLQSCVNSLTLFLLWPLSYTLTWSLEKHIKQIIHRCPNITYLMIAYWGPPYYNMLKLIVNSLPMLKTFDISHFGCQPLSIEDLILFKESNELRELIISKKCVCLDIASLQNTLKDVKISFSKIF